MLLRDEEKERERAGEERRRRSLGRERREAIAEGRQRLPPTQPPMSSYEDLGDEAEADTQGCLIQPNPADAGFG
mgnify:FL=1